MKTDFKPNRMVMLTFMMLTWCLAGLPMQASSADTLTQAQWQTPVTDLSGKTLRLADYQGKVVYLDFWASWCPPCRVSLPWMAELHTRYADQGLVVIANSVDENTQDAAAAIQSNPVPFIVTLDPKGRLAEQFNVPGMPTSYLIDAQGQIRFRHVGFRAADASKLEQAIVQVLKEPKS